MTLPTDVLVQKATTTTTQFSSLIPKIWAARIERNLRKAEILQQSILTFNDLLVPGAGDTLYVPLLPDLGAAGALTEGVDMGVTTMTTASSVSYVPTEYGVTVEVTRKALDRIKYDGAAEVVDRLSYAMLQTLEGAVAGLYNANVPGTSSPMSIEYANGKASGTMTSSDTFNDSLILQGVADLTVANNTPFEDGYWRLYISPGQYKALLSDTNTRQDIRWAAPDRLLSGEVGALHGCRIMVTNWLKTATVNGVANCPQALLLAPRWAAIAWKRRPEIVIDPTIYDMGRRRRFGITADFDIELLHYERGIVLVTAP